jgi:hypothetical protein
VGKTVLLVAVYDRSNHHHFRNSPFLVTAFLKKILPYCIRFSLFWTSRQNFFIEQDRQPCVQPLNQEYQVRDLRHPVTVWASRTARHTVPLSVAFYDSQGYGGGFMRASTDGDHDDQARRMVKHDCISCPLASGFPFAFSRLLTLNFYSMFSYRSCPYIIVAVTNPIC